MTESGFGEPEGDGKHNPDDNVMVGRALFLFGPNNFLRRTFAKVRSLVLGAGYREGGSERTPKHPHAHHTQHRQCKRPRCRCDCKEAARVQQPGDLNPEKRGQ